MTKVIGYLAIRDGRELFSREFPVWCQDDINYTVIELVANDGLMEARLQEARDARDLLAELYALQEEELAMMRERIKELEK